MQGLGAAGIMSVNSALVRFTYPQRMLGRAIGINAFAVAVAAAIGPTVASAILAIAHWRWLFAVNVPIGAITIIIALYSLPETDRSLRSLNYAGVALQAGTFALLIGGLQSLAQDAATPLACAEIAGGCILGALLVRHEINRDAPLIPFDLCACVCFRCPWSPLSAHSWRRWRASWRYRSRFSVWVIALPRRAIDDPLAGGGCVGRAYRRDVSPIAIPPESWEAGAACHGSGLTLLALFPHNGAPADLIWRMALCGLGFGFFQSPNNRTLIGSAPRSRTGAAGGMLATARLLDKHSAPPGWPFSSAPIRAKARI